MGISTKWLRSLVGLRKVERQQWHRKEDADVGVGPGRMHHGSQVLEIQNFNPTSLDDVAHVHSRSYITGLEKAMGRASDEGLIFIEGTGPTYATEAVMLYLGSYPGTGKINEVGQGDGEGMTLNLPLPGGTGDYAMRCAFDEVIAPSAHRNKPGEILLSIFKIKALQFMNILRNNSLVI
ncbi:unnamed protein product [Miscanthus lutarioriparius]|uniref:Histone deacetylase domain-containing protein n=1 Tax=Miscanthus lutarioriparius TaxID=422564 RepID=A0A811N1G2_9POAL|nr:unnamed protein product [Miscanthus lutarioriparius]